MRHISENRANNPINEQSKAEITRMVTPTVRGRVNFSQEEQSSGTKIQFKSGIEWSSNNKSKRALSPEQDNRLISGQKVLKKEIDDGGIEPYELTNIQVEERKGDTKPTLKKKRKELTLDLDLNDESNQVLNTDNKKFEELKDKKNRRQRRKNVNLKSEYKEANKLELSPIHHLIDPMNGDNKIYNYIKDPKSIRSKKPSINLKNKGNNKKREKNKDVHEEDIKKSVVNERSKSQPKSIKKANALKNKLSNEKCSSSNLISTRQDNDNEKDIRMRQYLSVDEKNKTTKEWYKIERKYVDELNDNSKLERVNKVLNTNTKRDENSNEDIIIEEEKEYNKMTKEGTSNIKGKPHIQYNSNKQTKDSINKYINNKKKLKLIKSALKKRDVKTSQEIEVPYTTKTNKVMKDEKTKRKHSMSVKNLHKQTDKNFVEDDEMVKKQRKVITHLNRWTFDLSYNNGKALVIKDSKKLKNLIQANSKIKVKVNNSERSINMRKKLKKKYTNRSASVDNTVFYKIQSILANKQITDLDSFNELLNDFYKVPQIYSDNKGPRSIPEALRIVQGKDSKRSLSISGPVQLPYPSENFNNGYRESGRFCE